MFPIETYSGTLVDPLDLDPKRILIEDIAHSLSLQCRYGGHCQEFYSVAQHSVLVALNLPIALQLTGLLHDASEAYLGDIISPLKEELAAYRLAEEKTQIKIWEKFCSGGPNRLGLAMVKEVDTRLLLTEARQFMPSGGVDWRPGTRPFDFQIESWTPWEAEETFLREFKRLTALWGFGK